MQTFLKGQKINLRGLRESDLEMYRDWMENPNATEFMETGAWPISDSDLRKIYEASVNAPENIVFVIEDAANNKPLGVVGLYLLQWVCRRGEFRILIGPDEARGKGFGSEAANLVVAYGFEKLNLETIYLGVNSENIGAVKSYENAGFKKDGIRRKMVYRNNRYYDLLSMSILREEYFAK